MKYWRKTFSIALSLSLSLYFYTNVDVQNPKFKNVNIYKKHQIHIHIHTYTIPLIRSWFQTWTGPNIASLPKYSEAGRPPVKKSSDAHSCSRHGADQIMILSRHVQLQNSSVTSGASQVYSLSFKFVCFVQQKKKCKEGDVQLVSCRQTNTCSSNIRSHSKQERQQRFLKIW